MVRLRLHPPQAINTILSILILFFSFSIVSFNVFTVPIEHYAPSLTSVWPRAIGFTSLFDSITTLLTVVYLNLSKSSSTPTSSHNPLTYTTRIATIPLAAFYLLLSLSKLALTRSSTPLLYLSVVTLGIPFAYFYLVGVESLNAWFPNYPLLAMTFVSLSYGLSQFVMAPVFYKAISALGILNALVVTSVSLFLLCSLCSLVHSFPTLADRQAIGTANSEEHQQVITDTKPVMPWYELIKKRQLYRYLIIVFLSRATYGLYIFYFKLGYVFKIAMHRSVIAFQLLALVSMVWTFFMNAIHQLMTQRLGRSITKPCMIISFVMQALSMLLLIVLSTAVTYDTVALLVISGAIALNEQATSYLVLLAKEIFGEENGMTAFGIAVALAVSTGEAFFPSMMALVETRLAVEGGSSPSSYVSFYVIGSVCLLVDALLVAL